jgi:hypothetical protein
LLGRSDNSGSYLEPVYSVLVLLNSPEDFKQFDQRVTIEGPSIRPFGAAATKTARLVISISSNDRPLIARHNAPLAPY